MFGGIPEKEIDELNNYWKAFPDLRDALFSKTSTDSASLKVENIKNAITLHANVKEFENDYLNSFGDFDNFLKNELLTQIDSINISKKEVILSNNIFDRLKNIDFEEDSYEAKIIKVDKLIAEEKKLKKEVKTETEKLHLITKETIEQLTDEQIHQLLKLKWITPLVGALNKLPDTIINKLTAKLQNLSEKYATTYADVADEIHDTEKTLSTLIDELTGNEFDMQGLGEFKSFLKGK